jgi:hypothetical protein
MKKSYLKKIIKEVLTTLYEVESEDQPGFEQLPFQELKAEFRILNKWYSELPQKLKIDFDFAADEKNPISFLMSRGWSEDEAKKGARFEELDELRVKLANRILSRGIPFKISKHHLKENRQPVIVGIISNLGSVESQITNKTHSDLKLLHGKRWRYNPTYKIVYWWDAPFWNDEIERNKDDEMKVEDHLHKKYGYFVEKHISLEKIHWDEYRNHWDKAHGLDEMKIYLNEALRGEWWIQDGQSVYADGDVGDINHEAHVINVLRSEILTYLGVDLVNYDYAPDFNDVADEILDNIKDELTKEEIEDWVEHNEYYNVIATYLKRKGDKNIKTKLSYLKGHNDSGQTMDAREYGLKYLGWVRVKGNEIQVNTLTSEDLKNITKGLYDAYNEELEKTNVQDVDETNPMGEYTFNIDVLSTKSYYRNVPWSVLAKDNPTALNPYRGRY